MDDYAFDVHIPDDATGEWKVKESPDHIVQAYDEYEASRKAEQYADNKYSRWRVRNVRLIKKFTNPDNEI
jgi:hypothetical protein